MTMKRSAMRREACAQALPGAALLVASVLAWSWPSIARACDEDTSDTSKDGAGSCAHILVPAFIASSSIQPYGRFSLTGAQRSATLSPFATEFGNTLTEYGLTASPQVGFRATPFMLVYAGGDAAVTSGANIGTLVAEGAVASGDAYAGAVVQVHGRRWRFALNGRLLRGTGKAIDLDRILLGVNQNFINSGLLQAIGQISGGLSDAFLSYTSTSGRLDLTAAYADKSGAFTAQGAIGGESSREDFPATALNDIQRVLTTAAPRAGIALGFDPSQLTMTHWWPVQFLLEYQVTVNRSWVEVYGAPMIGSPARIAENVIALGLYSPPVWNLMPQENLQIGVTLFYQFGLPGDLITASQQDVSTERPHALGVVTSLHYLF
jgi:hypothetical protein